MKRQKRKTPVVETGVNDKSICKIKSQSYDTQVRWVLKALCEGAHVHNLMMPVGYKLIDIVKTLKSFGINLVKHYDTSQRIWAGTGRPNVVTTWSLSEKDINLYKLIREDFL
jgi:hypothetical protein